LPLGDSERIFKCLLDAQKLAEALGDERRLGRVYAYLTRYFFGVADHERAVTSGQRALALAVRLETFDLQVTTQFYLGVAYHSLGDYDPAIDILTQNVVSLTDDLRYERFGLPYLPAVFSRAWLVWCLAERGEFAEAIRHSEEAMQVAEAANQPWDLMAAHRSLGLLHFYKGEFNQAIPILAHCLELCQRGNLPVWLPLTASTLGVAYTFAGRITEALPLLEQGADQRSSRAHYSLRMAHLSKGYLLVGRITEAIQNAKRALELARRQQERGYEAWSLWFIGEIAVRCDATDIEAAEAYYRQALTLAGKLGMRPLLAHCHLGLGTLYAKAGQREQAHTVLSTAMALYRTMDMTFWLSQAEHALAPST
jgi:tetratricopeptide (TPR) repeat protein